MATRKIIEINEDLCNGCGNCITGCAEGALQLVDGKAKLVKEQFCDGFGDCIGTCPTGALQIVERDADQYDEKATRENLLQTQGAEAVERMDKANAVHNQKAEAAPPPAKHGGGCPGMRMRTGSANNAKPVTPTSTSASGLPPKMMPSALEQWPIQLHLVQPGAPFFQNKEMAILSTCSPIASADVHWRFMQGRSVVVACPKLDRTEPYVEKLAAIFQDTTIPKAIVVRMEVPCCGGLSRIVQEAHTRSGRTDLIVDEVTLSLTGEVVGTKPM